MPRCHPAGIRPQSVFKIWMERRQQKPGSRFKSRLLIGLVALVLVPAVCVIAFSLGLLNRSIDKWFSGPVDRVFEATTEYQQQWQKEHENWARRTLQYI